MAKYQRTTKAGRYVCVVEYPRIKNSDGPKVRAEKQRNTTQAQKAVNERSSCQQLTAIIAQNFMDSPTAFFCSPTFDEDHYPQFEKQSQYYDYCIKQAKLFVGRLKHLVKRRKGAEILYVYSAGRGKEGRWHFHILIDNVTGEDLKACWTLGDCDAHQLYCDTEWLSGREWYLKKSRNVDPVAIAKYMMSNASIRHVGKHPWHASRNCARQKAEPAALVSDGAVIDIPENAVVLTSESHEGMYSGWKIVEYLMPNSKPKRKPRKKKKAA